jgi:hypothetical protein
MTVRWYLRYGLPCRTLRSSRPGPASLLTTSPFTVWGPNITSPYATWAYSWIRPPSRSRRRIRTLGFVAGG